MIHYFLPTKIRINFPMLSNLLLNVEGKLKSIKIECFDETTRIN